MPQFALEPSHLLAGVASYFGYLVFCRVSSREPPSAQKAAKDKDTTLSTDAQKLEQVLLDSADVTAAEPEPEGYEPDSEPDEGLTTQLPDEAAQTSDPKASQTRDEPAQITKQEESGASSVLLQASIAISVFVILMLFSLSANATGNNIALEVPTPSSKDTPFPFGRYAQDASHFETGRVFQVKLERQRTAILQDGETDYFRSAYYGTVQVGTPPQNFTVVFDTGSGHLVLPSMYCHSDTCAVHKRYRKSASKTAIDIDHDGSPVRPGAARDQITVAFGTGEVTGVFVEDLVCIRGEDIMEENIFEAVAAGRHTPERAEEDCANENSEEIDVSVIDDMTNASVLQQGCMRMRFVAATAMSEDPFKSFQFDGVLGLGLEGLSQTEHFNFLHVVADSVEDWGGVSQKQTFAVFLAQTFYEQSRITVGGWSRKYLKEEIAWNSVEHPELGHWIVAVKSIRIGNTPLKFCESGCKAVMDTGTSLLSVPSAIFPEMYETLKHRASLNGGCPASGPQLHVELENYTITIGPPEYARLERRRASRPKPRLHANGRNPVAILSKTSRADVWCKPTLMTLDLPEPLGPKLFILGEPVLRKYYTAYDAENKRIGVGRASHLQNPRSNFHPGDGGEDAMTTPPRVSMFDAFRARKHLV